MGSSTVTVTLLWLVLPSSALFQRSAKDAPRREMGHNYPTLALKNEMREGNSAFNVLITGANRGIGLEASRTLVEMGAVVYMACRDKFKCQHAADHINDDRGSQTTGYAKVAPPLDLSSMESVKSFGDSFPHSMLPSVKSSDDSLPESLPYLDAFISSAAVNFMTRGKNFTNDGFETTMQVNYVAPFHLIQKLTPLLRKSDAHPGGRIVLVSSEVHDPGHPVKVEDIDPRKNPDDGMNYALSKFLLAQLAQALTHEEEKNGVLAFSVHPGTVDTDLMADLLHSGAISSWLYKTAVCTATWWEGRSPGAPCPMTAEQGADTLVWAATDPGLRSSHGGSEYYVPQNDAPMPLKLSADFPTWTDADRTKLLERSKSWASL